MRTVVLHSPKRAIVFVRGRTPNGRACYDAKHFPLARTESLKRHQGYPIPWVDHRIVSEAQGVEERYRHMVVLVLVTPAANVDAQSAILVERCVS